MSYASINRVVLIGRLTRDPELRELPSGQSVCNLRIACNGIRRDEGEYRERPHYFDVSAFAGLAENVARYMRKGSLVAIDGRLEWREWETADRSRETRRAPFRPEAQSAWWPRTSSSWIDAAASAARTARWTSWAAVRTSGSSSAAPVPARSTWFSRDRQPSSDHVCNCGASVSDAPQVAVGRFLCLRASWPSREMP